MAHPDTHAVPARTVAPARAVAAVLVLAALLAAPVPLLPPHRMAEAIQSLLGVGWKPAYLAAALGLQVLFYGLLGALAALSLRRAATPNGRLLQVLAAPVVVVGLALAVRSIRAGHLPIWSNAVVPVLACMAGVWLGLSVRYRNAGIALRVAVLALGAAAWALLSGAPSTLQHDTTAALQRLVAIEPSLPAGDDRFGELLRQLFQPFGDNPGLEAVPANRAALIALGIAVGDPRLAHLVGLGKDTTLLRQAAQAGAGATLRGREDWPKHFTVSAALAVLEHPLVGDAAGLLKEQLDALGQGTGFSFADMAADMAGVRFARAATASPARARALRERLQSGYAQDDYFPPVADLPENLTIEQFRQHFDRAGSPRYRELIAAIDARLDSCPGLAPTE